MSDPDSPSSECRSGSRIEPNHSKLLFYLPRFVLNLLRGEVYLNVEIQLQDPEPHWRPSLDPDEHELKC